MNTRYGINVLLLLVLVATIGVWLVAFGSREIYSEILSDKYKLRICSRHINGNDDLELTITYHYPPAIGSYDSRTLIIPKPNSPIRFTSLTDKKTGIRCIFDNNNSGLLFLYSPPDEDLWHTGFTRGWASSKEKWEELLHEIKMRNPEIPYATLPDVQENPMNSVDSGD